MSSMFFLGGGVVVFCVMAALELLAYLLLRFGRYPSGIAHAHKEFPVVSDALLEKFTTWDRDLGWAPQASQRKRDNTFGHDSKREPVFFSTDHRGGRVSFTPSKAGAAISCYGDSFCFCREVNDDETWPWYLGGRLDRQVYNFGVGNYGLDQAVLRMERVEAGQPSAVVVMAVTSVTSERVQSVYKHFLDFGNVLGVKPRFKCQSDGGLDFLPSPVENKEDLKSLGKWRSHFILYDENYPYFLRKQARFPYLISCFRCGSLLEMLMHVSNKLQTMFLPKRFRRLYDVKARLERASVEYASRCWQSQGELIVRLIERFDSIARSNGSQPIFLLQHHKRWVKYCRNHNSKPYADVLLAAARRCPDLVFLDSMDWLLNYTDDELDALYSPIGSHHSPAGNKVIAQGLSLAMADIRHKDEQNTDS